MYEWLTKALSESTHVLTANRRLARTLQIEHNFQQLCAGHSAWRSPAIRSWQDWMSGKWSSIARTGPLPTRISAYQSHVLWERCLRREINDPLVNVAVLARQCRDSWSRLREWGVAIETFQAAAQSKDEWLFARAALGYASILEREGWIDSAGLPDTVTRLVHDGLVAIPGRIMLAGFDRIVPQVQAFLDALRDAGCEIEATPAEARAGTSVLHRYANTDAELRAAGSWARFELGQAPRQRIAVISFNLEQHAARYARLLREGLLPGWQRTATGAEGAVNVSYGNKLDSYPAIAIAIVLLRWLQDDLATSELGLLLRAPALGLSSPDVRSRLELRLRQMPEQSWSPQLLLDTFNDDATRSDCREWFGGLAFLSGRRDKLSRRATPTAWATLFDDVLGEFDWPGSGTLGSSEFQLVNRWRELLNDLAQLELVTPSMSLAEALGRLEGLANDTVFQPETDHAAVHLLGPLEPAGMQFDKIWITGLSADNWPPAGNPLSLVSRKLQRDLGMPDADPQDTLDYARRVLTRLMNSADHVVISCPITEGDAEQSVSELISEFPVESAPGPRDPNWYAVQLLDNVALESIANDRVPPVLPNEKVAGGAATIQRQFTEPFTAFAYGRLGARTIPPFSTGLAAHARGNLIHDALHQMYQDLPDSSDISAWNEADIEQRVQQALRSAFMPHERHADPVLHHLLQLEKQRVGNLLRGVIVLDRSRESFAIDGVERSVDAEINGVALRLRMDRIDRLPDGERFILDYKTGKARRLLNRDGDPDDMQLVAYAIATTDRVGAIGLINIDSRSIDISAAGRNITPDLDWDQSLADWKQQVHLAAGEIAAGDVRINALQTTQSARPLGLLSRFEELVRDR